MFLRRFERRKNGKPHSYWALVESYRTAKGSRQRVVAYLGELTAAEQDGWAKLGSHLGGEAKTRRPQLSLFDPPHNDEPRDDEPLLVKLNSIRLQRTRDFGDVWLAWGLWRMLGLDELLDDLIEPGREKVSWSVMAAISPVQNPLRTELSAARRDRCETPTTVKLTASAARLDENRWPKRLS